MNPRSIHIIYVTPGYRGGMIGVQLLGDVESSCGLSQQADTVSSSLRNRSSDFLKNAWRMAAATQFPLPNRGCPKIEQRKPAPRA